MAEQAEERMWVPTSPRVEADYKQVSISPILNMWAQVVMAHEPFREPELPLKADLVPYDQRQVGLPRG